MSVDDLEKDAFQDTPRGWANRWEMEFKAAKEKLEPWHAQAEKIVRRFKDDRKAAKHNERRLNLFTSNVQTLRSLLYGKTPQVEVSRRFNDSHDDIARVAGEMLERILNSDIERASDSYAMALQHALDDRLLVGLGVVRARYVIEMETDEGTEAMTRPDPESGEEIEVAPAVAPQEYKASEDVETDYVYWKDQLWSPCRTEHDKRWHAFRAPMSRKELVKRFGAVGKLVPLNSKRGRRGDSDGQGADPWSRSDVWEIWDKDSRKVFWYVEGYNEVLDQKPDPLELEGFWPFPTPMYANLTTSELIPVPDFVLAQDLYDEVDQLTTRIYLLTRAVKVIGAYDGTQKAALSGMLDRTDNEMVPVDSWAMFAEKGGIKGVIDWLPLDQIIAALDKLREIRTESMGLLFQVTGMSDIMRGQASEATTATEQAIKARFASVRVQSFQDEFARFASEQQEIKAHMICRWFEPQTIIERSNILNTPDAALAQQAVEFLKSNAWAYRVQVKPESVSLTDYAALKQERTEVISSIAGFIQVSAPLAMQQPGMAPFLLQMLQWLIAGIRGASSLESVLDQAISQAQQAATQPKQPPPPDPKIQAQRLKMQGDLMKTKVDSQARMQEISAETQSAVVQEGAKAHFAAQSAEAKERAKALGAVNAIIPARPQ